MLSQKIRCFSFMLLFGVMMGLPMLQAQITTDGTFGSAKNLTGPDYQIKADLGKQSGGNLFHSFGQFNIHTGERATFTGPDSVNNIISRITGGSKSQIDGILCSEIPGADMYFLNPAGFMFGKNAALDIRGSFHISTADYIRLGDQGRFDATRPENSVLSSAPPTAFGFLDRPEPIDIEGNLQIPREEILSVAGGDINIRGGSLTAPGGQIHLASTADAGEIALTDAGTDIAGSGEQGKISVSQGGYVKVSGNTGGDIYIRGGQFEVSGGSILLSMAGNPDGGSIDIRVTDDLVITDNASISAIGFENGDSGDIRLEADRVKITDGGFADVSVPGAGQSGDISITARESVEISGYGIYESGLYAQAAGSGDAGNVSISANELSVSAEGKISANTYGEGHGGNISLNAGQLEVSAGGIINLDSRGSGDAGNISVSADKLAVSAEGKILANTYGEGHGGNISLNAGQLEVSAGGIINSDSSGSGNAGNVSASANELNVSDQGKISANTYGNGNGGNITLNAEHLEMTGGGTVESYSGGAGHAGNITVTAGDSVTVSGTGLRYPTNLDTSAYGSGNGGTISIVTEKLKITEDALIQNSSTAEGLGGNITVASGQLELSGGKIQTTVTGAGDAGNISISAKTLNISDNGLVSNGSAGQGRCGDIAIAADRLEMTKGYISSTTLNSGHGGDISITARESVSIAGSGTDEDGLFGKYYGVYAQTQGSGDGGNIAIQTDTLKLTQDGIINGQTLGTGRGGNISLDANRLEVLDGGTVTADTFGSNSGGNVSVTAGESVTVSGAGVKSENSWIATEAHSGGSGGDLTISAPRLTVSESGKISVNTLGDETRDGNPLPGGCAGNILLDVGHLELTGGSVSSESNCEGQGGNIAVDVQESVRLSKGGSVSVKSSGTGDAGDIDIRAGNLIQLEDSSVTAQADEADGGNVRIHTGEMLRVDNSEITAKVGASQGNGGNLQIDGPNFAILRNSRITANAYEGSGGNISITAEHFLRTSESLTDASSELGINGNIEINSPESDLSGSMTVLPATFLSTELLLRAPCEARTGESASSFVILGRDATPSAPDDFLPSPPMYKKNELEK